MIWRRRFISAIAVGLITTPFKTLAQLPKVMRIGCLLPFSPKSDAAAAPINAMVEGLRDLGWVEGQNYNVEYRSADNRPELFDELARELVASNVDLIVAATVAAATAAKNATKSTPIVMVSALEPVKFGLIASLARPGANVTGTTLPPIDWGKWLELARESVSGASRVAIMANPSNPVFADYVAQNEAAAKRLGLQVQIVPVASAEEFDEAFIAMKRGKANVMVVGPDSLYVARMRQISETALARRLPLIGPNRFAAEYGALIGFGYDFRINWRRTAVYIDRILKGAKPSDLPVEQPTKFLLVINTKTAKSLGLAISQSLLLRADEVIQ